jgi:hypothetical protein
MCLITKVNDDADQMQPGDKIAFGGLGFIVDRFRNLRLQDLEPPTQQEE